MKRKVYVRLLVAMAALGLLLGGCQYNVTQFGSGGGYVACLVSGIDAEGKAADNVVAAGTASVRVGNCNGDPVEAHVLVETEVWYHTVSGGIDVNIRCRQSALVNGYTTETVTALASTNGTDCASFSGGYWFARSRGYAWIQGNEHISAWYNSPLEAR